MTRERQQIKRQQKLADSASAEARIKQAAKKLFTQKGFDAVRTRDIAREAGINLALLNYYFRSKERLFHLIMSESLDQVLGMVATLLKNDELSPEVRMQLIVQHYIDTLLDNPDLPLFVLTELRREPEKFPELLAARIGLTGSTLGARLQQSLGPAVGSKGDMLHFIANLLALTVFPFVAAPTLKKITGVSDTEFVQLMEERKKRIPVWMKAILTATIK